MDSPGRLGCWQCWHLMAPASVTGVWGQELPCPKREPRQEWSCPQAHMTMTIEHCCLPCAHPMPCWCLGEQEKILQVPGLGWGPRREAEVL